MWIQRHYECVITVVCHVIKRSPVLASRGNRGIDGFDGFKLYLIIAEQGELVACFVTPGHVDDRNGLKAMAKYLTGKLFGDNG